MFSSKILACILFFARCLVSHLACKSCLQRGDLESQVLTVCVLFQELQNILAESAAILKYDHKAPAEVKAYVEKNMH